MASCVGTSPRLCTWMRSIFGTRSFWNDASIWARAAAGSALAPPRPATFTLVAQKILLLTPSSLASVPPTCSDAP